jgi:hypothetical protein
MTNKWLPRSVDEVIAWSRNQKDHPTQSWEGMCQSHCRNAYGVPAWAPSAAQAWEKIPDSEKHKGGNPNDAPRGALLYYLGGKFGHVALAIGKTTPNGKTEWCLSNDYSAKGKIGVAPRTFARWGNLKYVGWSNWTPSGSLKLDNQA